MHLSLSPSLIFVHTGVVASFPERAKEQLLRLNLDGPIEQVCICVCMRSINTHARTHTHADLC